MKTPLKDKILKAATSLLMINTNASMDEIAEAAGIGRATLFRAIKNRKALMHEIELKAYEDCNIVLQPILYSPQPADVKLRKALEAIIPLGAQYHYLSAEPQYPNDLKIRHLTEIYQGIWQTIICQNKTEGLISSEVPAHWAGRCLDHLIYAAWEAVYTGELAPKEAPERVLQLFFNGFKNG